MSKPTEVVIKTSAMSIAATIVRSHLAAAVAYQRQGQPYVAAKEIEKAEQQLSSMKDRLLESSPALG